jgi:hypothetical protein
MNLRFLPLLILTAAVVPFAEGCVIGQCDNNASNCLQIGPATRFEGNAKTASSPYVAGQGVRVASVNGNVKVSVGSTDHVEVSYVPFVLDKKTNEAAAKSQIDSNLVVDVSLVGNDVVVKSSTKSGSSSSLGADLTIKLPQGFSGAFEIAQQNGEVTADLGSSSAVTSTKVVNSGAGSVSVVGARGALTVSGDVGDVTVGVSQWGKAGENGTIHSGNGAVTLSVPSAADGQLVLTADGMITLSSVPSSWTKTETSTSKTFTMGAGTGAHLDVKNDFGDIALTVQ